MSLQDQLDAQMRTQLRSRYRPLPELMPEALGEPDRPRPPPVRRLVSPPIVLPLLGTRIVIIVADEFDTTVGDLRGNDRARPLVFARFAAYRLMSELGGYSTVWIGRLMGNRHHTSAINGLRKAAQLMERDADWRERYERAAARLR